MSSSKHHRSYTLAEFFAAVYRYLAYGMATSACAAYAVASSAALARVVVSPLGSLGSFVFLIGLSYYLSSGHVSSSQAVYLYFAMTGVLGLNLGVLSYIYTTASVTTILGVSSVVFAVSSVYGLTTDDDLTRVSGIAHAVFYGAFTVLMLAMVLSFLGLCNLRAAYWLYSLVIAIISPPLIASCSQDLASIYYRDPSNSEMLAPLGALMLFVLFIRLFQSLLHLFGARRDQ